LAQNKLALGVKFDADIKDFERKTQDVLDVLDGYQKQASRASKVNPFTEAEKGAKGAAKALEQPKSALTEIVPRAQRVDNALAGVASSQNKMSAAFKSSQKPTVDAGYALTNLQRVISDMPYGLIGIQNNLDPLAQSFSSLSGKAGGAKGALQAIGRSLTGTGGILFGLSLAGSVALMFGDKIVSAFTGASKVTRAYAADLLVLRIAQKYNLPNTADDFARLTGKPTDLPVTEKQVADLEARASEASARYNQLLNGLYEAYEKNLEFGVKAESRDVMTAIFDKIIADIDVTQEDFKAKLEEKLSGFGVRISDLESLGFAESTLSVGDFGALRYDILADKIANVRKEADLLTASRDKAASKFNSQQSDLYDALMQGIDEQSAAQSSQLDALDEQTKLRKRLLEVESDFRASIEHRLLIERGGVSDLKTKYFELSLLMDDIKAKRVLVPADIETLSTLLDRTEDVYNRIMTIQVQGALAQNLPAAGEVVQVPQTCLTRADTQTESGAGTKEGSDVCPKPPELDDFNKKLRESMKSALGSSTDYFASRMTQAIFSTSSLAKLQFGKVFKGTLSYFSQEVVKILIKLAAVKALNAVGVPVPAFASGTSSAPRGVALVGEEGPELVRFHGGESVSTARETARILDDIRSTSFAQPTSKSDLSDRLIAEIRSLRDDNLKTNRNLQLTLTDESGRAIAQNQAKYSRQKNILAS